jgi:cyclohexa-1,5-dienecarbonyl-CoA hydratase
MKRIRTKIEFVEKLYLEELMATHDAVEGLTAFVAKRAAVWQDK